MCNPRRVEITATRQLSEAWAREVRRVAEVQVELAEEARIVQPIAASVGRPVLAYLERLLRNGSVEGWQPDGDGYRFAVDGGHARYDPATGDLEIVARAAATIRGTGEAEARLSGQLDVEISSRGGGRYYDNNWGGHTEERAREPAPRPAEAALTQEAARQREAAAIAAEATRSDELDAAARTRAQAEADRLAGARRDELRAEALAQLERVGVRVRQAFFRLIARAYSEALQGLARSRGAEGLQVRDGEGFLEIGFDLPKV